MRHIAIFAVTLAALLAVATPARAGMVEDCEQVRNPNLGISGCTAMIRSGQYSGRGLAINYTNRGNAYKRLGEYRRAIEDYDQALRLDPGNAHAYVGRGGAYALLGEHRRAIKDYDQALMIDPNHANTYRNRGIVYGILGKNRRAIQDYDQALRLDPGNADTYAGRGDTYYALGEHRRAIQDYDQALRLDPGNAHAYAVRGNTYGRLGEYRRAFQDVGQALRLDPGNATYEEIALLINTLMESREASQPGIAPSTPEASNSELEAAKAKERRWDERTRRGVQNALMWTGDYNARLDGDFGPITRKAIRNFQSRNGYASTGYLTAPQIEILESQRLAAIDYVGFRIIDEMEAGIRIGIPEKVFRRGVRDGVLVKFESAAGFPPSTLTLVSFLGGGAELNALYYQSLSRLKDGKSAYQVFRDDWFVVSYEQDGVAIYSYGTFDGAAVKGFTLFWASSDSKLFQPISAAMFNSFESLKGIALDSGVSSTGSEAFAEQGSVDRDAGTAQQEAKITSTGTGFFVDVAGHLLTNAHVVEGCGALTVGDGLPAELLTLDGNADLALLLAPVSAANGVARFSARPARLNADVTVVGFPLYGLLGGLNVTRGAVSSTSGLGGDDDYFQMSAAVQPGNSGGPVVNEYGAVVGVVQSKLDAISVASITGDIPQNINFAIRAELAKLFLNKHSVDFQIEANQVRVEPWVLADDAKRYTVLISCWKG